MENRSTLLDFVVEGPFQLHQLFRVQEIQLFSSSQALLNLEPDLPVLSLLPPCKDTEFYQFVHITSPD